MSSLVINNIKKRLSQQSSNVTPVLPAILEGVVQSIKNRSGGPESTKIYGCSTCVVNSKILPDKPASLSNSRTPIVSVKSTPDSASTKRRIDNIRSLALAPGIIDPEQRFSYILPPIVPPPDIIAICNPYRNTNEPVARIPPCIGPKRINT